MGHEAHLTVLPTKVATVAAMASHEKSPPEEKPIAILRLVEPISPAISIDLTMEEGRRRRRLEMSFCRCI